MAVVPVQTYDLPLVQAKTLRLRFAWRQNDGSYADLNDWDLFSQVRAREAHDSDLLLNLTPYLSVANGVDDSNNVVVGKHVWLIVPGRVTAPLEARPFNTGNAAWDLFAVSKADSSEDALLVQGGVAMDPAVTDMTLAEA